MSQYKSISSTNRHISYPAFKQRKCLVVNISNKLIQKKKKKISNKPNGGKTNNTEIMTDTLSSSMEK